MNRLPLRYFPDAILTKVAQPIEKVTPEITQLAKDMLLTMMVEKGIGLAGPQVGRLLRIFVVDVKWPDDVNAADPMVFINPVVTPTGPELSSREGCLSFPGPRVAVARPLSIHVEALDMDGEKFTLEADGLLAKAIQHENDHLDGKTLAPRLSVFERRDMLKTIKKKLRKG
jgi:peptide deformylase